ncbi:hypothetical protein [Streptomyces lancefieldiae]|uniref:Small hydrophilic protein n=1 Tax=Streptomyces lancefieldiae TaxID=3075520 RepID=A0ABU3AZT1_9ACTN|nr:hypothetical protein [Streptomyces sp. DSM 40712]MDT0615438.1 hypothetical protein [Streptomyces sp. DSM 40712]
MAKNKNNRDRKQPQAERAQQSGESPVMRHEEQHAPQMTPGDVASRKRQKRFGHN